MKRLDYGPASRNQRTTVTIPTSQTSQKVTTLRKSLRLLPVDVNCIDEANALAWLAQAGLNATRTLSSFSFLVALIHFAFIAGL